MKRRVIMLFCITALSGAGCRVETDSSDARLLASQTPLIDGFTSCQRAADVEKRLRDLEVKVTVLEDGATEKKKSKLRPPLSVRVLIAPGFSYLGMQGDLRLEFVDDELAATWFYPSDAERFAAELKRRGVEVGPSSPFRVRPATELRAGVDYRGRRYWAWEDVNLRRKVERWIKKHA